MRCVELVSLFDFRLFCDASLSVLNRQGKKLISPHKTDILVRWRAWGAALTQGYSTVPELQLNSSGLLALNVVAHKVTPPLRKAKTGTLLKSPTIIAPRLIACIPVQFDHISCKDISLTKAYDVLRGPYKRNTSHIVDCRSEMECGAGQRLTSSVYFLQSRQVAISASRGTRPLEMYTNAR